MARLLVVFPQGDQSERAAELLGQVYLESLVDCRLDDIEEAARRSINERGRVFMPKPGELLEHIDAIQYDRRMSERTTADRQRMLQVPPPTPEEEAEIKRMLEGLNERMRWREPR